MGEVSKNGKVEVEKDEYFARTLNGLNQNIMKLNSLLIQYLDTKPETKSRLKDKPNYLG